ncbi:hypothetical protein R0J87_15535 [Halomonas sp. SIMBA_159]
MNQENQVFRVTMTGVVQASNPIEAAHLFAQSVGQPGFDKFQVADSEGQQNVVDMGLLFKMGILKVQEPEAVETAEDAQATAEEVAEEV